MKPKSRPTPVSEPRDNLEALDYIGPKWAERLQEIGIARYEDLAQYTPQSLAKALNKKAGKEIISADKIDREDWIGQARRKVGEAQQPAVPADPGTTEIVEDNINGQGYRKAHEFTVFFDRRDPAADEGALWQTRVYHNESGEEEPFDTLDPAAWLPWMFGQAHLPGAKAPAAQTQLEIVDLLVDEASVGDLRGLAVTLAYTLHIPGDLDIPPRLRLEIFVQDDETGFLERVLLQDAVETTSETPGTIQAVFPTPSLGVYWLHAMLTLLPPHPVSAVSTRYERRIRVVL